MAQTAGQTRDHNRVLERREKIKEKTGIVPIFS
jgi:hypothetical protein